MTNKSLEKLEKVIKKYRCFYCDNDKTNRHIAEAIISALPSMGWVHVSELPERKEKTADRQLYTWKGKIEQIKYYESDRDIGHNNCLDEILSKINKGD